MPGPTMVVVGGVHGNEPAGVHAIKRVLRELSRGRIPVRGQLLGLAGNVRALARGQRFMSRDLNRRWYPDHLARLRDRARQDDSSEDREQRELLKIFDRLDERFDHPLVIMDLHSFSAEGPPFSVVADTLRNRPIALDLRVPIILGLEETVEGTMLGYLADLGHVAVGFEAGQHDDPRTVENHVAAIWIAMVRAGLIAREDLPELAAHERRLDEAGAGLPRAVEIVYRHAIVPEDEFRMDPGFHNFQALRRNQRLATDREGEVRSPSVGRILMPLYQGQGEDGFFIAKDLGDARLQLSVALRKLKVDGLLPFLPGVEVSGEGEGGEQLVIRGAKDRRVIKGALRMLGYRRDAETEGSTLAVSRRRQRESTRRGRGGELGAQRFASEGGGKKRGGEGEGEA
ncbi:succinylglutamate desuccinylase/aspartoacylase family protein [Pseudenhygromyxa sp. WMMC2535]|uniref:succinylglutamate desuccinylase/aspartoacylase family protein n=1 Tax=Pseudenhygromyxa sp. WMMC2535 TaxID=2712867 RepID=UPI00155790D1|nr:succinylglutamate desuccinylase/aspartoacylase family protein [Pseudenhygromyxa sp. WMMC2535]NVB41588.1 succinylglutamate desuccinylase/aspartoacylase family protein [Pseudenhygromyxa sp. WMMC2535]